ncbi:hypothetical protein HZY86_08100 [Aerococcaceae bacterium DSM 111020]|nr:hypothetical protein [Aerococcaceae bacterium DSM 111020]
MVYREYLPYKSAREYQDRKMAKWMGFFLSEHTSSLQAEEQETVDPSKYLPLEQVLVLLKQSYLYQFQVEIRANQSGIVKYCIGTVDYLDEQKIGFKTSKSYDFILLEHIIDIYLQEEG